MWRGVSQDVQARRVDQIKPDAKRQHINGREDWRKKNGACGGRPRRESLEVERYAALAILAGTPTPGCVAKESLNHLGNWPRVDRMPG
jgi:hypothetical protein